MSSHKVGFVVDKQPVDYISPQKVKPSLQKERSYFDYSDLNEISEIFEESKRLDDNDGPKPNDSGNNLWFTV